MSLTIKIEAPNIPSKESVIGKRFSTRNRYSSMSGGMLMSGVFKGWNEISMINYMTNFESYPSVLDVLKRKSAARISSVQKNSIFELIPPATYFSNTTEYLLAEKFPKHVTKLMNEDNYWGCFYNFPELFEDEYSPVVQVRTISDVPELVSGVLTRDMVSACLTYLRRTPILGDLVYIKLDLSSSHLINIEVLQHYKYLVYLDLSSNLLTELTVLSNLLYLQFLNVSFNRLGMVLEYETPQWFLTEVHYKFNSVKRIRDLSAFWSITILDLSHNNIKSISGLESLRYLRRLDLSFNHIQRFENLNHLRLLWLDLSYNNISSFEFGPNSGLWTLLHLEYLNLNENNLTSMKMFLYCTRLRELHARNNRLNVLLELAVYMAQMRRLVVLDLRGNPICVTPGYKDVVVNTFPYLLSLDAMDLNPVEQRTLKMEMKPDVMTFATRRLLRLLYIQQLSRSVVSPYIPPADTTDVPIVVLVGHEAVGKGNLTRRLAAECSSNVMLGCQHTTATHHFTGHYKEITRTKFDDMLLAGEFLTYSEMDGDSYGLSREEAFVKDGKIRVVNMDLVSALMLRLRGYRPYLILATCQDKTTLVKKQLLRKVFRNKAYHERTSFEQPLERSTLQVLLSGRIIITGILNEILLTVPEEKEQSEFMIESECSLMMDSEARRAIIKDYAQCANLLALISSCSPTSSLDDLISKRQDKTSQMDQSLYSLYKESQGTEEYNSYNANNGPNSSLQDKNKKSHDSRASRINQTSVSNNRNTVDFSRYTSSTWKGMNVMPGGSKSSKSVTFTSQDQIDTAGMMIEPGSNKDDKIVLKSISARAPMARDKASRMSTDSELWLAFLTEAGMLNTSSVNITSSETNRAVSPHHSKDEDRGSIIHEMDLNKTSPESVAAQAKTEDYEDIHRKCPGMFSDTINLDNPDQAFNKLCDIIKDLMNTQSKLKPMFDIDFAHLNDYPTVEYKLNKIRQEIAPKQLFF